MGIPRFLSVITLGKRQACHVTTVDKLQVVGGVCFVTLHSPSLSFTQLDAGVGIRQHCPSVREGECSVDCGESVAAVGVGSSRS